MPLRTFQGHTPTVHESAYVDPSAILIGQVEIAAEAFVLPMVVARGDVNTIRIGAHTQAHASLPLTTIGRIVTSSEIRNVGRRKIRGNHDVC